MHREETATDSPLLSEAKALYRAGNCEEAASLFRQCRGNEQAEALCFIATMILDKVINPRTSEDPEKLLQKSADMGFPPAKYRLESLRETQDSIDDAMAMDSQQLTPPKEYTEKDFLKDGNGDLGIERRKESVLYYANQGYVNAMYEYGMINLDEESRDLKVGAFWLGRAAQKGHAMAQYELGCLYFRGEGVPKDDLMALLWLGRAREQGIYRAHCELAKIYTDRKNKFYSPEEGVRLLNQVKELCPEAYMMLAQIYLRDDIVQYDAEKAREYLEKAKAEGVLGAYVEIAKLYILERKYSDALPLLKHVADKQDSESLYLLALIFERFGENKALDKVIDNRRNSVDEHGENVKPDISESSDSNSKYLQADNAQDRKDNDNFSMTTERRPAETSFPDNEKTQSDNEHEAVTDEEQVTGDVAATDLLKSGVAADILSGIIGDISGKGYSDIAYELYGKSAELGFTEAQYKLACIYHKKGLIDDAMAWYKKAADHEHIAAMYEYATMLKEKLDAESASSNHARPADMDIMPSSFRLVQQVPDKQHGYKYLKEYDNYKPKYHEAFEYMNKAALGGEPRAQYLVSQMYSKGEGVRQDFAQSIQWCEKAANAGDLDAQLYMAELYDKGEVLDVNLQKSVEWYRMVADKGNAKALFRLGKMYFDGRGVQQDYAKAFSLYVKSAENGYIPAMESLAICYINGRGCTRDESLAEKYLSLAVEHGSDNSVDLLAGLYMNSNSSVRSPEKALNLLEKEVALGHSQSMLILSRLYLSGGEVPKNVEKGLKLLEQVVAEGNREALYELGMIYYEGKIVPRNYRRAVSLINDSAEQNYVKALYMMGIFCYRGIGMISKTGDAFNYFRKAGELGYLKAYLALGQMYEKGIGGVCDYHEAANYYRILVNANYDKAYSLLANVYLRNNSNIQINYDEAEKWLYIGAKKNIPECAYRLGILHMEEKVRNSSVDYGLKLIREAAERNYADALYYLACLFMEGNLFPRDYSKAIGYLQRAVGQNHLKSTTLLGKMYRFGLGCEINNFSAGDLLSTAAKCGDHEAQLELAKMYRDGAGVDRSYVDAYMWTVLCLSFDNTYRDAINFKNSLLSHLSQRELKNGQVMAIKYLGIIEENRHKRDAELILG